MIRKYAVAAAAALALCSGAIASTAVSLEADGALQIRLLSGSSYPEYEAVLSRSIRHAPRGAAVRLETDRWMHFGRPVSEALRERDDLKFSIEYKHSDDACTAPVSRNELVGALAAPDGTASFPILCLAFAHDEADVLSKWRAKDHAALERMSHEEKTRYLKTLREEDRIRRDIIAASAAQGGRLVKLQFRLKSPASTYEKMHLRPEKSSIDALTDLVRYTVVFDRDQYSQGVDRMLGEMSSKGYELASLWNAWTDDSSPYRGINLVFCDPKDKFLELQIHTPRSVEAADREHVIYERRRLLPRDSEERKRLEKISRGIFSEVPVPEGVEKIESYRRSFSPRELLRERSIRRREKSPVNDSAAGRFQEPERRTAIRIRNSPANMHPIRM